MKRLAILAILVMLAPMSAYAGAINFSSGTNGILSITDSSSDAKALSVGVSKGVSIYYNGVAQGYLLGSRHQSGTKTYGTSSGDTGIKYVEDTGASLPSTVPTGTGTGNFGSTWKSL